MSIELGALIILAVTNLGTLGYLAWHTHLESKEKSKTINALIAKNAQDFSNFELSDKMEKVKVEPQPNIREDLQELSDLSDKEFDEKVVQG
jgi:hypothetical protein